VNKILLSEKGFPYPIVLSSLGVVSSAFLAHFLVDIVGVLTVSQSSCESVRPYWRTAFPVGAFYAAALAVGDATYLYIGVGLIQMLKSSTPVIIMGLSFLVGVERPTPAVLASVGLITLGTVVTCAGSAIPPQGSEGHAPNAIPSFNWFGIILFMISSFFEAARLVATQHLLTNAKFTVIEGQVASQHPKAIPSKCSCLERISPSPSLLSSLSVSSSTQYHLSPTGAACLLAVASVLEVPQALRAGALGVIAAEPGLFLASVKRGHT
jgi:hypothetical protein